MKQILLDTSFILTCIKQKIDFFEELVGNQILVPIQVIRELKNLEEDNSKLSLKLLDKHKFKKIDLELEDVDKGIINFAKENNKIIIATLDREIKKKTKNPKIIIRGKKRLEFI